MSSYQAIATMQKAIIRYIDSKIPKNLNKAQTGIIDGKNVRSTNGRTYRAEPVTNIYYGNGSKVTFIIPDGGGTAAIVGVNP